MAQGGTGWDGVGWGGTGLDGVGRAGWGWKGLDGVGQGGITWQFSVKTLLFLALVICPRKFYVLYNLMSLIKRTFKVLCASRKE